jgi:L-fuculose-phosphate aldolase
MRRDRLALQRALVEAGDALAAAGLVAGSAGNLSARARSGRVVCTPSGASVAGLTPGKLVTLTPEGKPLRADQRPSSEVGAHLAIYVAAPSAAAVVHAHPIAATALSLADPTPDLRVTAEGAATLGLVARVAYLRPGRPPLADACGRAAALGARAILMRHHGAICWGASLDEALARMLALEHVARIVAAAPGAARLPAAEVAALREAVGLPGAGGVGGVEVE